MEAQLFVPLFFCKVKNFIYICIKRTSLREKICLIIYLH